VVANVPAELAPICVMGPTGAGKSAWALAWAERLQAEIISVDSAQVYVGMDIGTAKPSKLEQAQVPHHLLDICDPKDHYSVAQFVADAKRLIGEIQSRGRRPLLVGGTMLYFRALQAGLASLPARDASLRATLEAEAAHLGWAALHARLAKLDPKAAGRISPNDAQRITRALEVYALTGSTLSSLQTQSLRVGGWPYPKLILAPATRASLQPRLQSRLLAMRQAGLVAEVSALKSRGDLSVDLPALRAVGYRQIWAALQGEMSVDAAFTLIGQATWALAKRQYTWLKREPDAQWIDPADAVQLADWAAQWLP